MFLGVKANELIFTGSYVESDYPLYRGLFVPQAWSLGIELCFYLVAPFVLRNRKRTLILFVISGFIRFFAFSIGFAKTDPWTYRFFPFELALFMLGALSHQSLLEFWKKKVETYSWLPVIGTASILLILTSYGLIEGVVKDSKPLILIAAVALLLPLAFLFQRTSRVDNFLGELSYPVYIGHLFVISSISYLSQYIIFLGKFNHIFLVIVLALLLAMVLKVGVVDPCEQIRRRIKHEKG